MPIDWRPLAENVAAHQRFLLTSHQRPDCDALGSELGLAAVLEQLGKTVVIVNADPVPDHLRFIDPESRIQALGRDIQPADAAKTDVIVVLDTSAWIQLGPMGDLLRDHRGPKLVIDHHVSEDDLGAIALKDVEAEATGRLVVDAAEALGATLTPAIANALFAAIATDTGWFRFNSTTGATFRAAARLLDSGASPSTLYRELYEQDTLARVRLRGRVLGRTAAELDGRLMVATVFNDDFAATGARRADTEDLVNLTLAVRGSEAAVIFMEQTDSSVKVSFRSRTSLDCARLAEAFGGGGHRAAAGAQLPGPLAEAQSRVLDAVRAAMR